MNKNIPDLLRFIFEVGSDFDDLFDKKHKRDNDVEAFNNNS
jgi:hypothetical protein